METQYLVINKNKDADMLPFSKQFVLFQKKDSAIRYAKCLGYEENFMGVSNTPGMASVWVAGDVNVMILPID